MIKLPLWAGRIYGFLFCAALFLALGLGSPLALPPLQALPPAALLQQGVEAYQAGDYTAAIDRWHQALAAYSDGSDLATQALLQENLARAYQQVGQSAAAIDAWAAVRQLHRQRGDFARVGRAQTEQAQVHLSLGQGRRALALLCRSQSPPQSADAGGCDADTALALARRSDDRLGQVAALGALGEAYRLQGDFDQAQVWIQQGLALARQEGDDQFESLLRHSLGSGLGGQAEVQWRRSQAAQRVGFTDMAADFAHQAQDYTHQAMAQLDRALAIAQQRQDGPGELDIQLNRLALQRRLADPAPIATTRQRLFTLLQTLPPSRQTAYGAIALAQSYRPLGEAFQCVSAPWRGEASTALDRATTITAAITDHRAESFALGELGHLAACQDQLSLALALTQQAQVAATQGLGSPDSLYLWQWQAGRIYRRMHNPAAALVAYHQAVATLESIRTEILVADEALQFDFRDTIEPIYRQLLDLQLASVAAPPALATKQNRDSSPPGVPLQEALTTVDALRLAELQNYFGRDCLLTPVAEARVDLLAQGSQTAVISSVIFADRTALILTLPEGPPQLLWVEASQEELRRQVIDLRLGLEDLATEPYDTRLAKQLYDAIIAPLEPALQKASINTLVFIHDGFLRSVPMAALYDGQQFLVERYAIATTPALTLTATGGSQAEGARALVLGSSQAVQVGDRRFPPLPEVPGEVASILATLPGSRDLVDGDFNQVELERALQLTNYSILHFATHGQFSPDPQENFLVTGQGEKLTFSQLEGFIRNGARGNQQVDLVMLTACETAAGDDRATLGLAGLAIRAGARRAVASLWQVEDQVTAEIARDFYAFLSQGDSSPAQSLQRAQIEVIKTQQGRAIPGKWAALVLVGNWL